MTTVVPRGAGRKAHDAKTSKAAQRTPLPSRVQVLDVDLVAEQAKAIAAAVGRKQPKSPSVVARAGTAPVRPTLPAPKPVRSRAPKVDHPSKAVEFAKIAKSAGWKIDLFKEPGLTARTRVTASRNDGVVIVWFQPNDTMDVVDLPTYTRPGGTIVKLRNVSAAKKQVTMTEDERPIKSVVIESRRHVPVGAVEDDVPRRRLPFDVETAHDDVVLAACNGARITWRNSMTGLVEVAYCTPNAKQIKVTDHRDPIGPGARLLHFTAIEGGFRVVRLDRMLTVTKPTSEQATRNAQILRDAGIVVRDESK